MSETKRTKNIAFRLTDEEYAQIEKTAMADGDDKQGVLYTLSLCISQRFLRQESGK